MSLPALTTLQGCTSLSKTVLPFLPQLSPTHLLPILRGQVAPAAWYLSTNPLMSGLAFALLLSAVVLIVSEVNGNYSQVDRLWSLLPAAYIGNYAVYAHLAGVPSQRLDTLLAFSALWSVSCVPSLRRLPLYLANSGHDKGEINLQLLAPRRLRHRV